MEPSFNESKAKAIRDAEESIIVMEQTIAVQELRGIDQSKNKEQLEKLKRNLVQIRNATSLQS